ncbi:serine protease [Deinococcus radiopugnans]|uniref:Serine protease n=2 Tax=Deinococcus radiopugnans TaxID=57497 RepID=A0A0A7KIS9_9DEIO|nr:trypsin-like peptidase domain-containing protein [Deinococcus radiopugnans]AIZ44433.1 serine protease [Deinococcus radiopugnans]QLG10041.1 trypsin-like peptidase domain-containing protein [Deinococcus sp. D7000]
MKKNLSILALSGTLALGAFVGYGVNERSAAQNAAPVTAAQTTQGQMVQALATPPQAPLTQSYDGGRARTESEANTVNVVKARQGGLVYVSVTEKADASASPQAQLRKRMQEQMPFGFPFGDGASPFGDGGDGGGTPQPQTGTGSGFFVSSAGDIITNNHVVDGASEITIRVHGDKTEYKAKVIARAPDFDLALIRAEGLPKNLIQPIPLGDSSQLDVGLKAVAMGAPFGLDFSVSEGIISSLERTAPVGMQGIKQSLIQTDAAINPGNSGGPLLNSAGEVIGVNTQILTGGAGQSAGVGFAIPVNTVKKLLPQLQAGKGGVVQPPRMGITFTDISGLSPEQRKAAGLPENGALVQSVVPGSPAANASLQAGSNESIKLTNPATGQTTTVSTDGDLITAIDGQPITDDNSLQSAVLGKSMGDSVKLTVRRGGQTREVTVNLGDVTFPTAQQQ